MSKEENNKKETEDPTPPIIEKDEIPEEPGEKADAEKEEVKAKANKKKANKKRTKKKKAVKKAPSLIGKKIVMKMTLGTPELCFLAGSGYVVGKDLSVETAQAWLNSGAAELIGNLPSPSEFK